MIQPLRTVHRSAFAVLAVGLPVVLALGLTARHPRAVVESSEHSQSLLRAADGLWQRHAIRTEFRTDADHPGQFGVALLPAQWLNEPDVLLYWSGDAPRGNTIPEKAQLLGPFAPGKSFPLAQRQRPGYLVLYSPAHQAVIDTAKLESLP